MKTKDSAGCGCGGKMKGGGDTKTMLAKGGKTGTCGCGGKMKKAQSGAKIMEYTTNDKEPRNSNAMLDTSSKVKKAQTGGSVMAGTAAGTAASAASTMKNPANPKEAAYKESAYKPKDSIIKNHLKKMMKGGQADAGFTSSANAAQKSAVIKKNQGPVGSGNVYGTGDRPRYKEGGLLKLRVNHNYIAEAGRSSDGIPQFRAVKEYKTGGMIGRLVNELRREFPGDEGFIINGVRY